MSNQEMKRKRSSPIKSNKEPYLTPAQRVDRDRLYDECERFVNPDALRRFKEKPYQLKYMEMVRQVLQE